MTSSASLKSQLYGRKHFSNLCCNIMRCSVISLKTLIYLCTCLCHTVTQNFEAVKLILIYSFIWSSLHAFKNFLLSMYYNPDSCLAALNIVINRTKSLPSWSLQLEGGRERRAVKIDNESINK